MTRKTKSGLTAKDMEDIKLAVKENRIAYDHGNWNHDWFCDCCGQPRPKHVLSLCDSPEDKENDPMSGYIIFLGSTCYKKLKGELGLE